MSSERFNQCSRLSAAPSSAACDCGASPRPECLLITDDYLPHVGGSRVYCHRVASLLAPRIAVITRRRAGGSEFDANAPYPIKRIDLHSQPAGRRHVVGEALDVVALASAVSEFRSGRCLLAGEVNPSAFSAAIAGRGGGMRFGVILHDEPLMGCGSLESALRKRILRKAGVIVCSSSFPRSRAEQIVGGTVPIVLAPPGVDAGVFHPGQPDVRVLRRYGVERDGYLLSVGRLVAYKNISSLIEALAASPDQNLRLVVAGAGPSADVLLSQAKGLGVAERVLFPGYVDTPDLVELYRGALAYVFPSRPAGGLQHEGIGMAALDAAACGCPVIASTATSASDFIEDGKSGVLFDPLEAGALLRAVERLTGSAVLRSELAGNALQNVRSRFSWRNTADAVSSAIAILTGQPPSLT